MLRVVSKGVEASIARCVWSLDGPDLVCVLPSGREMRYPHVSTEVGDFGKPQVTYDGPRGRRRTYGGMLVENITQATARDLLAETLVRLECNGWNVVLHVHDEVVVEVPDTTVGAENALVAVCEELPSWAEGLPLKAEAQSMQRYRK